MKDTNKNLIILAIIVVVVVYFLFFKQKEGFTVQEDKVIIPSELFFYGDVILPKRYGNDEHPEVIKARKLIINYFEKNNIPLEKVAREMKHFKEF